MIELLNRANLLHMNNTFASFINEMQDAIYNPTRDPQTPMMMYFDDIGKSRFVSQVECDKMNRKAQVEFDRHKDDIMSNSINLIDEIVFALPGTKIGPYVQRLASGLEYLTNRLGWESIIFLLEYPTPWLSQDNDFKPVKHALHYLGKIGVTDTFTGGFKASGNELKELIQNIFWIGRCNASLPTCYFSGIEKGFTGYICKYGNLHFYFYSHEDREAILRETEIVGLEVFTEDYCYDNFSETNAIEGRQIIV